MACAWVCYRNRSKEIHKRRDQVGGCARTHADSSLTYSSSEGYSLEKSNERKQQERMHNTHAHTQDSDIKRVNVREQPCVDTHIPTYSHTLSRVYSIHTHTHTHALRTGILEKQHRMRRKSKQRE
jgi:hypothetical protein